MTSVHGITVFGGTFPAEIWHSLYSGAEVPCEEFSEPETPISWAPFFGRFTLVAAPTTAAASTAPPKRRPTGPGNSAKKRPAATTPTPTRRAPARNRRRRLRRHRPPPASTEAAAQPARAGSGIAELAPGRPSPSIWAGFVAYLGVLGVAPRLGRRAVWGAIVLLLVALRLPAAAALPRRLQLRRLRPPRRPPRPRPLRAPARLGAHRPRLRRGRPGPDATSAYGPLFTLATYPLAWLPGRSRRLRAEGTLRRRGPRPSPPRRPARRRPRSRPPSRRRLRRPQPAGPGPRRRRPPQRRPRGAASRCSASPPCSQPARPRPARHFVGRNRDQGLGRVRHPLRPARRSNTSSADGPSCLHDEFEAHRPVSGGRCGRGSGLRWRRVPRLRLELARRIRAWPARTRAERAT